VFTGLVESVGTLAAKAPRGSGFRLGIEGDLGALDRGESIAVNGACLTVAAMTARGFEADVSVETVERTTLGDASIGGRLNLERALRAGARLGGHLVSGHVDGIADVVEVSRAGEATRVIVQPPAELMTYLAPKGSVTLDGVSLTTNRANATTIELMLIPHTLAMTNLQHISKGRRLNIEVDVLARYVVHHLRTLAGGASGKSGDDLLGALRRAGFISE
jgi:riboflavin synthase